MSVHKLWQIFCPEFSEKQMVPTGFPGLSYEPNVQNLKMVYIDTWNPNDPCFEWSLGLLLEGSNPKIEDISRFQVVTVPHRWFHERFCPEKLLFP